MQKEDGTAAETEGTVLRLEDLDVKFEEENQAAKQEEDAQTEPGDDSEEGIESGQDADSVQKESGTEEDKKETDRTEAGEDDADGESGKTEEAVQSEQAFARNFAEYYKIEKGDTLNKISIKIYGDTGKVKEICDLNKIKDPDDIKYGQKILLP